MFNYIIDTHNNNTFRIDILENVYTGDGCFDEVITELFSNIDEPLQDFIERYCVFNNYISDFEITII